LDVLTCDYDSLCGAITKEVNFYFYCSNSNQ